MRGLPRREIHGRYPGLWAAENGGAHKWLGSQTVLAHDDWVKTTREIDVTRKKAVRCGDPSYLCAKTVSDWRGKKLCWVENGGVFALLGGTSA